MWTNEDMGREHWQMDRPGVCHVPEGGGEMRKLEKTLWQSHLWFASNPPGLGIDFHHTHDIIIKHFLVMHAWIPVLVSKM